MKYMENPTTIPKPQISAPSGLSLKTPLIIFLFFVSIISIGILSYSNNQLSQQIALQTAQLATELAETETSPTIAPIVTVVPTITQTANDTLTQWRQAKYGGVFVYDYPSKWHVAELWPSTQGAPIAIVMDPNPISTSPGDGPLSKFTIDLYNGLPNPDDKITELKSQFNSADYTEVITETINSENGPILYYSGKIAGEYRNGTKLETYVFSLRRSDTDPYNVQVFRAMLSGGNQQQSQMLRHIVLSFKMQQF